MSKLKVEVIEPNGFKDGEIPREFGDVFTSVKGQEFVDLGWCKDYATGYSGERIPGVNKLQPDKVIQNGQS